MTQGNGEPNPGGGRELRYELSGDGIEITYSQVTSSDNITTQSLSYRGLDQSQPMNFSGTEIRSQQSELGTLLTLTLQIIMATGEETKLTLLLPPLHATLEEVPIKTLAIGTKSINPTMGPPIEGQLLTYVVFNLEGNRKLIFYQ